jgi:hypothetical protein
MARPEDIYGDVKIPRFEAMNSSVAKDGWKHVPSRLEPEDYSSAVGVRVFGLPPDQETQFTLESTYLSTQRHPAVQLPYSLNRTRRDRERMAAHMKFNFNATAASGLMPGEAVTNSEPGGIRSFLLAVDGRRDLMRLRAYMGLESTLMNGSDLQSALRRRLVVGFLYRKSTRDQRVSINLSNCTLSETRVEAAVFCPGERFGGGGCIVKKVRLSLGDNRPHSLTRFDNWISGDYLARELPRGLPDTQKQTSLAIKFLSGMSLTNMPVMVDINKPLMRAPDTSKVPPSIFSKRLSLLLNTQYDTTIATGQGTPTPPDFGVFGNVSEPLRDIYRYAPNISSHNFSSADEFTRLYHAARHNINNAMAQGMPFIAAATTATARTHTPIYVCSFGWLAVLLLAAVALLASGVASLALQLRCTLAPDMLRCVASMTYANPHFRTPPGGTALDGMARAQLLRRMRVRVGDISGGAAEVGEVAFVALDCVAARELERERRYA